MPETIMKTDQTQAMYQPVVRTGRLQLSQSQKAPLHVNQDARSERICTYEGLDADECTERGTDQVNKTAENGDGTGNDVREQNTTDDRAEPNDPVLDSVFGQVLGTSQDSNKEVFGGQLNHQHDRS